MPKPALPPAEFIEGPEAFERFRNAMKEIVSVSKDELTRREATWHRQRQRAKPKRRQQGR